MVDDTFYNFICTSKTTAQHSSVLRHTPLLQSRTNNNKVTKRQTTGHTATSRIFCCIPWTFTPDVDLSKWNNLVIITPHLRSLELIPHVNILEQKLLSVSSTNIQTIWKSRSLLLASVTSVNHALRPSLSYMTKTSVTHVNICPVNFSCQKLLSESFLDLFWNTLSSFQSKIMGSPFKYPFKQLH